MTQSPQDIIKAAADLRWNIDQDGMPSYAVTFNREEWLKIKAAFRLLEPIAKGEAVIVPREPLPAQLHAGAMAIIDNGISDFGRHDDCVTMSARLFNHEAAQVYRAMIKAAKGE